MVINPQQYSRPATVAEAVGLLAQPGTYPLCGGAMALGHQKLPYAHIVDLQDLDALKAVDASADDMIFGGGVLLQTVLDTPDVPVAVKRALTRVPTLNHRNNTSIMETLLLDNPPAEWLAALAALHANLRLQTADGVQSFPITDTTLVAGPGGRSLTNALLLDVTVPRLANGEALGNAYLARTPAGDPIVCAATFVKVEGGAVSTAYAGVCGASEQPCDLLSLGALVGAPLDAANIAKVADTVPSVVKPVATYLGSVEYRAAMAGTLVGRALRDAAAQLQ